MRKRMEDLGGAFEAVNGARAAHACGSLHRCLLHPLRSLEAALCSEYFARATNHLQLSYAPCLRPNFDCGPDLAGCNLKALRIPFLFVSAFLLLSGSFFLSAAESDAGHSPAADEKDFQPLFSPLALRHWRQCGPGYFTVTNGIATGEGGMGLWRYSARQFTNFVLRGEFIQEQEIADSGVFVRFPDPKDDPWNAVHQGHEMEIGDPNPKDPTWRTGSIYPFQALEQSKHQARWPVEPLRDYVRRTKIFRVDQWRIGNLLDRSEAPHG